MVYHVILGGDVLLGVTRCGRRHKLIVPQYGETDKKPVRGDLKYCSNKVVLASMERMPEDVYKFCSETMQQAKGSGSGLKLPGCYACWACGERAKPRQKMQVCAACKKIARNVTYCSRYVTSPHSLSSRVPHHCSSECQVRDWKTGTHKTICGKVLTEDAIQTLRIGMSSLPPDFELPPPPYPDPDPSFTQSPALLYQVQWLRRIIPAPDHPDYVVRHISTSTSAPESSQ